MDLTSTIVAVSSPPGRSTRGLVRMSGTAALDLAGELLGLETLDVPPAPPAPLVPEVPGSSNKTSGSSGAPRRGALGVNPPRGLYRGRFDLGLRSCPILVLVFRAPNSYTRDDTVECFAPGHPVLLERMVDRLIDVGRENGQAVRRAEPGEFTARAYFRGRLSLTQADGVAATISARSDAELRAAHLLSSDALGIFALELADQLARALALVEAGIDFTDAEDVVPIAPAELTTELTTLIDAITSRLEHAVGTEVLAAIPWVTLAGPPNAGKSTLFNALLGQSRAIVSAQRGTTRDVLVEPLVVPTEQGPAEVLLVDVAGEEKGVLPIELAMQAARRGAQQRAELVLRCVPPGEMPGPESGPESALESGLELGLELGSRSAPSELLVLTKSDLRSEAFPAGSGAIAVSAQTGAGLKTLRRAIATQLAGRAVSLSGGELVLRPRHDRALRQAVRELTEARTMVQAGGLGREPELVAAALRLALDELGVLAGTIPPDDVLDHVFGSFCVGK